MVTPCTWPAPTYNHRPHSSSPFSYTSQFIASGPKYLTGVRHFLADFYPDFDVNRSHPLVSSVIRGSKKLRADPVQRKPLLRLHHLSRFVDRARSSMS